MKLLCALILVFLTTSCAINKEIVFYNSKIDGWKRLGRYLTDSDLYFYYNTNYAHSVAVEEITLGITQELKESQTVSSDVNLEVELQIEGSRQDLINIKTPNVSNLSENFRAIELRSGRTNRLGECLIDENYVSTDIILSVKNFQKADFEGIACFKYKFPIFITQLGEKFEFSISLSKNNKSLNKIVVEFYKDERVVIYR